VILTTGERLRVLRGRAGLTLAAAAGSVGCSAERLARVELGAASPSLILMRRLAELYGVAPTDLIAAPPDAPDGAA